MRERTQNNDSIDLKTARDILESFHTVLGVPCRLFDREGSCCISAPTRTPVFCAGFSKKPPVKVLNAVWYTCTALRRPGASADGISTSVPPTWPIFPPR